MNGGVEICVLSMKHSQRCRLCAISVCNEHMKTTTPTNVLIYIKCTWFTHSRQASLRFIQFVDSNVVLFIMMISSLVIVLCINLDDISVKTENISDYAYAETKRERVNTWNAEHLRSFILTENFKLPRKWNMNNDVAINTADFHG